MGAGRARLAALGRRFKKKALDKPAPQGTAHTRSELFRSIFSKKEETPKSNPTLFLPPEAFGSSMGMGDDDLEVDLTSASAWDVAIRYHELKARPANAQHLRQLRKISAQAVLERAREIMGSVVHPQETRSVPWTELPGSAEEPDFDLDETLENSPLAVAAVANPKLAHRVLLTGDDVWMSYNVHRRQAVVLSVDTSLSMTGEKLALTAVALAVVLLQFPEDPVGIIAFENEAKILKRPTERVSVDELVERFIDVPAQGYTHLEDGMKEALRLVRSPDLGRLQGSGGRPASTVLVTDGKYTAGRDPAYLAGRFPHLVVIKMGKERASLELCRELAQKGSGVLREVAQLEALPAVMYGVVKDLLRGRSVS
jgi:Mg-chelatase subunit ChlD